MRVAIGSPTVLLLCLGVTLLLSGCRSNVQALRVAVAGPSPSLPVDPPHETVPAPPPRALEAPLGTPAFLPRGAGIVVCEPVAAGADAATADFGAGCGRWLFFTVGGQPALGRTPLWSEVQRVQSELHRPDLRLSLPDAVVAGGLLGVTHVAVGTIGGRAARCTLTYRLWAVPHGRAVGGPLTVSGTQAQILARLPGLAHQMAQRLGVAAARLPEAVGAPSAALILAGQVPWGPEGNPVPAQAAALRALAPHWPLAALLALDTDLRGDPRLPAIANALLTQAPDNPFGYAQLGYVQPGSLSPFRAALADSRRRFPGNYILAHTEVWWDRESKNWPAELGAAMQAARDAPGDADAWLTLGYTLSDEAERVRQGRTVDTISAPEWRTLNGLYARWLAAVSRAARLDPRYGRAWLRVAEAATFDGQDTVADTAWWNAWRNDPDRADVYEWGLQMYQEKWGGDPATLSRVASLAAADHYATEDDARSVSEDLQGAGLPEQSRRLMENDLVQQQAVVVRYPNNAIAHWNVADALQALHRTRQAVPEYRAAARLLPGNAELHHALAEALYDEQSWRPALSEYRAALRLAPGNVRWHFDYGWELKGLGRLAEAETQMRRAAQLDPRSSYGPYGLGVVLDLTHRTAAAIAEYQRATTLEPLIPDAFEQQVWLLDNAKNYDAALAAGRRALAAVPEDTAVLDDMADCFLNKKQWPGAIAYCRRALQVDADDALAHLNLGEADIGQGHKDEARAEWEQAAALDHGQPGRIARALLAKHP